MAGACQTDREVTRPEPVPVTEELLTDALLTQEDVPPPYVLDEDAEPLGPEIVPSTSATTAQRRSSPRRAPT